MLSVFQVPKPVKAIFDKFPLETYPPVQKCDDATAYKQEERTFYLASTRGSQQLPNETFKLGVYNVFEEPNSKCILASDPWCLFTQLALCKKNDLKLCSKDSVKNASRQHSICILSQSAALNSRLPILVEGSSKRNVRSTESINEILNSRVSDPERIMYMCLLDTTVYDCWVSQVLLRTSNVRFLEIYYDKPHQSKALEKFVMINCKVSLMKRNNFYLRHSEIFKNIKSATFYNSRNVDNLVNSLFTSCEKVLSQFQELLGSDAFFLKGIVPTYLDIKIASYIVCILNLEDGNPLHEHVLQNCGSLIRHAEEVIKYFAS